MGENDWYMGISIKIYRNSYRRRILLYNNIRVDDKKCW